MVPERAANHFADYVLLKREIKAQGLLERQPAYYAWKIPLTLALLGAAMAWGAVWHDSRLVFIGALLWAGASGQIALLAHDAAHGGVFATHRRNSALSLLVLNLLSGFSYSWWRQSHNTHHMRSNDPELDPDIDFAIFAFSEELAATKHPRVRPILRRQHIAAFALMGFTVLSVRASSLGHLLRGRAPLREVGLFLLHYIWYPLFICGELGVGRGLLFILIHQLLFGYYLGTLTAVNHWAMPLVRARDGFDFVRYQVVTSRNLTGGWLVEFWFGGTNSQIEHHLFPSMPRNSLKRARPLVKEFCQARSIPYCEMSAGAAYAQIFTTLRRVARHARAHDPHDC